MTLIFTILAIGYGIIGAASDSLLYAHKNVTMVRELYEVHQLDPDDEKSKYLTGSVRRPKDRYRNEMIHTARKSFTPKCIQCLINFSSNFIFLWLAGNFDCSGSVQCLRVPHIQGCILVF